MYADLKKTKGDIVGRVGVFSDTFSPKIDKTKALKIILDIIGIGFSIIAAPGWNLVAKTIVPKAGHDALGAVKDFRNNS
jgi:TRAP-type C4-dicarboxylate transport system permease small subunit